MKGWTYKQSLKQELEALETAIGDALDEEAQAEFNDFDLDVDDMVDRLREIKDHSERIIGRLLVSEDRAKVRP